MSMSTIITTRPPMTTGRYVSAAQAADLCGVSSKTVERWIKAGKLTARRAARNRYEIAVADLPGHRPDPLDELRTEIAELRRRLDAVEQRPSVTMPTRPYIPAATSFPSMGDADVLELTARPAATWRQTPIPTPDAVTPTRFRHHAEAARWLARHGTFNPTTCKSWPGWQEADLTPTAALSFVLRMKERAVAENNHRIAWELHPCDDPACVCGELLVPVGIR